MRAGPSHLEGSPGTTTPPGGRPECQVSDPAPPKCGPRTRSLSAPWQTALAGTAHLRPGAESLPQPQLHCTQSSPTGLLPSPSWTPGGARAESLLQLPSVPPEGRGAQAGARAVDGHRLPLPPAPQAGGDLAPWNPHHEYQGHHRGCRKQPPPEDLSPQEAAGVSSSLPAAASREATVEYK